MSNTDRAQEQPVWKRSFRIGRYHFTSRQNVSLQRNETRDCFLYDGKWVPFRELPLSPDREISDEVSYLIDGRDGGRVLAVYEDVPTFDSSDAMYDCVHKAYIKRVGDELAALFIGNGYYLSRAEIYLGVLPENDDALQLLRDAGLSE
ncbi:MAG: hypothetical protein IJK02_03320 [Clostridia bacterium]|nr:hypothetical protein [Clostridia bacterium]MBR0538190.1 hypothetical protein [Clostridia bacterium]